LSNVYFNIFLGHACSSAGQAFSDIFLMVKVFDALYYKTIFICNQRTLCILFKY